MQLTYCCRPAKLLDTKLSLGPKEKKEVVLAVLLPLICSGCCGAIGWKKSRYDVMCNPNDRLQAQRLATSPNLYWLARCVDLQVVLVLGLRGVWRLSKCFRMRFAWKTPR